MLLAGLLTRLNRCAFPTNKYQWLKECNGPLTNETYSSGYCFGFSPNSLLSPAESHVISDTINSTKIGILYMYVQKKTKKECHPLSEENGTLK